MCRDANTAMHSNISAVCGPAQCPRRGYKHVHCVAGKFPANRKLLLQLYKTRSLQRRFALTVMSLAYKRVSSGCIWQCWSSSCLMKSQQAPCTRFACQLLPDGARFFTEDGRGCQYPAALALRARVRSTARMTVPGWPAACTPSAPARVWHCCCGGAVCRGRSSWSTC